MHDSFASYRRGDKTTDQDDLISFNQKLPVNDLNNYIRHYVTLKSGHFLSILLTQYMVLAGTHPPIHVLASP